MVIDGDHRPFFGIFTGGGIPVYTSITLSMGNIEFSDINNTGYRIDIVFWWLCFFLRMVICAISRMATKYGSRGWWNKKVAGIKILPVVSRVWDTDPFTDKQHRIGDAFSRWSPMNHSTRSNVLFRQLLCHVLLNCKYISSSINQRRHKIYANAQAITLNAKIRCRERSVNRVY